MKKLFAYIFFVFLMLPSTASACRYNVRDVGFVDFSSTPYVLYLFLTEQAPVSAANTFSQVCSDELQDSNVKSEVVHLARQGRHPATAFYRKQENSPASLVLVDPQGRSIQVGSFKTFGQFRERVRTHVQSTVLSPMRTQIRDAAIDNFAALLLVECKDEAKNKQARKHVQGAISQIENQMKLMPKKVAQPPALLTLKHNDTIGETLLLWSLGFNDTTAGPHAVVIYGRARIMGEPISYPQIVNGDIINLLYIIGADCECGLDRKWMQGALLPLAWGTKTRKKAAAALGFDPANPSVKMEISLILKKGPGRSPGLNSDYPDVSFGYQEIAIVSDGDGKLTGENAGPVPTPETKDEVKSQDKSDKIPAVSYGPQPAETLPNEEELYSITSLSIYILGSTVAAVLITGAILGFVYARKNR